MGLRVAANDPLAFFYVMGGLLAQSREHAVDRSDSRPNGLKVELRPPNPFPGLAIGVWSHPRHRLPNFYFMLRFIRFVLIASFSAPPVTCFSKSAKMPSSDRSSFLEFFQS